MPPERTAKTYSSGITSASKAVLLEVAATLRAYRDALVLIGGWVPYLLLQKHKLPDSPFDHVGSIDIDLAVDPEKIEESQYATIVGLLKERGYTPRPDRAGKPLPNIFEREVISPADGQPHTIHVDFLTHWKDPRTGKHRHLPVQDGLLAQKTMGCEAAFQHNTAFNLTGVLPKGGEMTVPIRMADLVGCLTMKGIVLGERYREKDAYDVYALAAHYQRGPADVAAALKPHVTDPLVKEALYRILRAFATREAHGPVWVAEFLEPDSAEGREGLITEAFGTLRGLFDELLFTAESNPPSAVPVPAPPRSMGHGSPNAFLEERRQAILREANGQPFYVLSATPASLRDELVNIADERLRKLLQEPPGQRLHGWNLAMEGYGTFKPSFNGLIYEIPGYKRLEVFRNGYVEFRVPIDPDGFRAGEVVIQEPVDPRDPKGPKKAVPHMVLGAVPVAEYPVSFCRFAKEYAQLIGLGGGEAWLLSVALYNVKGVGLYEVSRDIGWGPHRDPDTFWPQDHLEIPPYQVSWTDPPDQIARRTLDRIWNAFGYERPPYFDANGNFVVPTR